MALKPVSGGLRRFVNDSNEITRIDIRVAPGAFIEVDDDMAAQLPSAFKDPDAVAARDAARANPAPVVEDDADEKPVKKSKKAES